MEKTYSFTTDDMLKFYSEFDVIEFKYNLYKMDEDEKNKKSSEKKEKDEAFERKKYMLIQKQETSYQFASLTKKDYASEAANFDMVYDEKDKSKQHIQLLHLISEKIINQYINIDGVERLFSDSYIEFEWEMHFSADYDKHNMTFYRDHFIHQIRDAFMMHILLNEFGFYEKTKEILLKDSESKVSRYVCKMLQQQENMETDELKKLHDEDFYIRNLIYMSSYMSGLFHDIGYPESYFISTNRHISNYIPELHNFNGAGGDLKRIFSLLQNSLLFRVVPFEEIEGRLRDDKKPNHGALSAVIFLLHFYENGAIYRLEPYKVAAIEIAGLAIYNHTNKYEITKGGIQDAYRPCFTLNPISYILRICDDLQEWERIYFLISNSPSILFCNRCKTPVIREMIKNNVDVAEHRYKCNCSAVTKPQDKACVGYKRAFDGEHRFHYRRLYNVSVCDDVRLHINDKNSILDVHLEYDLYKLLHAAYINPDFSFYRIMELNELKKLFIAQRDIPQIYLHYTMTANPLLIKAKILEEYLCYKISNEKFQSICESDNEDDIKNKYGKLEETCQRLCGFFISDMTKNYSMCYLCKECEAVMDGIRASIVNASPEGVEVSETEFDNAVKCLQGLTMDGKIKNVSEIELKTELEVGHKKQLHFDCYKLIQEYQKRKGNNMVTVTTPYKQRFNDCKINKLMNYLESAMKLYINLYLCMNIYKENNSLASVNEVVKEFLLNKAKELIKNYAPVERKDYFAHKEKYLELQCLIEDCFLQFSRMFKDDSNFSLCNEDYLKQYEAGECHNYVFGNDLKNESIHYYHNAQSAYVNQDNYVPFFERQDSAGKRDYDYVDAYTDLYIFSNIHKSKLVVRKYISKACTEQEAQKILDCVCESDDNYCGSILDFAGIEEFDKPFFGKLVEFYNKHKRKNNENVDIPIICLNDRGRQLYNATKQESKEKR